MVIKLTKKNTYRIFIISLIYFSPKWFLSFYLFEEDILNKVIYEIDGDGSYYLPFIKYLAEINFSNSFDNEILGLKNIPIPFGSIFIHSLLYLVSGSYSIIIIEFFAVFFFLLLFSSINNFFLPKKYSLPIATFFLIIPLLVQIPFLNQLLLINVFENNFFNFRIHRPMMTTLFVLVFILVMMNINKKGWNNIRSFFLGIILAVTFSGFYYYFVIMSLVIFFYITSICKLNYLRFLKDNFKNILILFVTFIFFSIPFIINIFLHEENLTERMGIILLDGNKKFKLLQYYITNILDIKFIIFTLLAFFSLIIIKKKNIKIYEYIYFFFMIFISSIISPLIFLLLSNKTGLIYHFNNNMIMFGLIYFIICFFCIIFLFCKKIFLKFFFKFIYVTFFILIIGTNFQKYYNIEQDQNYKDKRIELNEITKNISINIKNDHDVSILTFDNHLMIWGIMKNIKSFTVINGLFSPKKNSMIEDDLIDSFKFLGLDENHFYQFLQNEKKEWRYINFNVRDFFLMRYQANSLNTFNNKKDFEPEVLKFINASSPALSQQLAIPNHEFARLREKFIKRRNNNFLAPNLIVLSKNHFIFKNINNPILNYCKIYDGKFYILFYNMEKNCKIN